MAPIKARHKLKVAHTHHYWGMIGIDVNRTCWIWLNCCLWGNGWSWGKGRGLKGCSGGNWGQGVRSCMGNACWWSSMGNWSTWLGSTRGPHGLPSGTRGTWPGSAKCRWGSGNESSWCSPPPLTNGTGSSGKTGGLCWGRTPSGGNAVPDTPSGGNPAVPATPSGGKGAPTGTEGSTNWVSCGLYECSWRISCWRNGWSCKKTKDNQKSIVFMNDHLKDGNSWKHCISPEENHVADCKAFPVWIGVAEVLDLIDLLVSRNLSSIGPNNSIWKPIKRWKLQVDK